MFIKSMERDGDEMIWENRLSRGKNQLILIPLRNSFQFLRKL